MLCYAYGYNFDETNGKNITNFYCGGDEELAIKIAKEKSKEFFTVVVKGFGAGGVIYRHEHRKPLNQ